METGINVEAPLAEHVAVVTAGIVEIFRAAAESRMDQGTVMAALQTLERASSINGMTIQNCRVNGETNFN